MRGDPFNWSIPLPWRPFGVVVRIHILFLCVALGVVLWVATSKQFASGLWSQAIIVLALLFLAVLAHEFGHVFAARRVGGDAMEILLWPLGGLAHPDVPHSPRANFYTVLGGPLVNLILAGMAGIALASFGFVPPFNPLSSPLNPQLYSWKHRIRYGSVANPNDPSLYYFVDPAANEFKQVEVILDRQENDKYKIRESNPPVAAVVRNNESPSPAKAQEPVLELKERPGVRVFPARLQRWQVLLAQIFAVHWLLFCVNLLPAFPLDGGRMLQCWLWKRGEYRPAIAMAAYVGFLVMLIVGVYAIAVNDLLPAIVALVIYMQCRQQLVHLEQTEEPANSGYDFSQGYTSLEREDPPPAPKPPPTWFQRWMQRRSEKRAQRDRERREAEERRLDELLDKIHRHGKQSLTPEEIRFLARVSAERKNSNQQS